VDWTALLVACIVLLGEGPASSNSLDLVSEQATANAVLSDGLPDASGQWRTKVQQIFNSETRRIERRRYEYFDPDPSRHLDVVWYPQDEGKAKSGRITGTGRMVWRRHDSLVWDPAGVVGVYKGEMRAGKADGKGDYVTADGLTYEGDWRDGRASGMGHLKLASGAEYSGRFRDGKAEGQGREFEVTGEVFEGDFHVGRRHGKGKTKLPSGFVYESSWTNGVENQWSQRIRLAQAGNANGLGGDTDLRMAVNVLQKPALPDGVEVQDVVTYGSSSNGSRIVVQPVDKQLLEVWKGNGEIQTQIGGSSIRNGFFGVDRRYIDALPPTFVLGLENHSAQPITIAGLRLEVAESNTDNEPAVQLAYPAGIACMTSYTVDYNLENFGESAAMGAQMRMRFSAPGGPQAPEFTKPIGNLAGRKHIDLEQDLAQFNVNVMRLKKIQDDGINCPSGSLDACLSSIRTNPLFGSLGRQLGLDGLQITLPASGFLDYTWVDNKGGSHSRSSPFQVKLGLGKFKQAAECGEGAAPAPTAVKAAVQLQLDSVNYSLDLNFQRTIGAGQVARFSLPLAAPKSSEHDFRIVALLSDGRTVSSLPISLLYFRPKVLPKIN
jgi:hypothetical protein